MSSLVLGLGLGLSHEGGANAAPSDIALSASSVAENAALGTVIGALSVTDPDAGDSHTFSIVSDPRGWFDISGSNLIVAGGIDFETDSAPQVRIRATDSFGNVYEETLTITVTNVNETNNSGIGAGGSGDGTLEDDGNFTVAPTVHEVSNAIRFTGRKASGGAGKFILDLGRAARGTKYTMRYDPDWSQLANLGVTAMVAFGFKQGNNFHLSGLKGDGGSGVNAYKISGTNWTATSGFTTEDGGDAAFGTQDGPNWLQIEIAPSGANYTLRTSSDGSSWTDEFTAAVPSPFSTAIASSQFGIAVFLESADAGPFDVQITLWQETYIAPLDGLSPTAAWSMDRDLLTTFRGSSRYTLASGLVSQITDQTGNARHFAQATGSAQPAAAVTAGGLSYADFDGVTDTMATSQALSNFISASAGFIITTVWLDAVNLNQTGTNRPLNDKIIGDQGEFVGISARNNSGNPQVCAFNWDGTYDIPTEQAISLGAWHVLTWRHEGGTLFFSIDGGAEVSVASGNTTTLTNVLRLMADSTTLFSNGRFIEAATFSSVPSQANREALIANFKANAGIA